MSEENKPVTLSQDALLKGITEIVEKQVGAGFSKVQETRANEIADLTKRVEDYQRKLDEAEKARAEKDAELQRILKTPVTGHTTGMRDGAQKAEDDKLGLAKIVYARAKAFRDSTTVDTALRGMGWNSAATTYKRKLDSATGGSGADLIPPEYSNEFIEYLRAMTVIRASGARTIAMPEGNLDIGRQNNTASITWTLDGTAPNESSLTTGRSALVAKKAIAVTAISNDLIRRSVPGADGLVQDDLTRAMAVEEDGVFLRSTGGSSKPKGIRYSVVSANAFGANASYTYANAIADINKMVRLVAEANIPLNDGCWYEAPRSYFSLLALSLGTLQGQAFAAQMMGNAGSNSTGEGLLGRVFSPGSMLGGRIFVTTQIPTTLGSGADSEVYFGSPAQALIGQTLNMQVTVDPSAAYVNSSGSVVSAFSQDETAVRIVHEVDFILRHNKAFSVLTGVNWL